jgi:hypothetical protein
MMSRTLSTAAFLTACFFVVALLATRHGSQTIDGSATVSILVEAQ